VLFLWITDLSIPWIQAICRTNKCTEDNLCLADGRCTKKDSGDGSEDGVKRRVEVRMWFGDDGAALSS
jgi:hypothetical protein